MMTSHSRSCYSCLHSLSCYARIKMVELIQDFKVLATSRGEAEQSGCPNDSHDLLITLACACTVYVSMENQ